MRTETIRHSWANRALNTALHFHDNTVLLRRGRLVFVTYGLLAAAAFLAGMLAAVSYAAGSGQSARDLVVFGTLILVPSILLGSRGFSVLLEIGELRKRPLETLLKPGYMLHGGVLGGAVGIVGYTLVAGVPMLPLLDAAAFGVPLGEAIARLGCHVYGCCWGKPTSGRLAIRYTNPESKVVRMAPHLRGKKLFPAQLLGGAMSLTLFGLMLFALPWLTHPGMLAAMYLVLHPILRLVHERVRDDDRGRLLGAMTHTHLYSLLQAAIGMALMARVALLPAIAPVVPQSPLSTFLAHPELLAHLTVVFAVTAAAFGLHVDRVGCWIAPAKPGLPATAGTQSAQAS